MDKFNISDYIKLNDAGELYAASDKERTAIQFNTNVQLQSFIDYIKDFIKYSISWEKALTKLLTLCEILVKDSQLADGRSILIILPTATWLYTDDSSYAELDLNIVKWRDFEQWHDYRKLMTAKLKDLGLDVDINNNLNKDTNYREPIAVKCSCGSDDFRLSYLQLSLSDGLNYQYSITCLGCGKTGPKSDTSSGAIIEWNNMRNSNDNNDDSIEHLAGEAEPVLKSAWTFDFDAYCCPTCGKPIVYTPGAKFCIFCGQRLKEWNPPAADAHLYKSNNDTNE